MSQSAYGRITTGKRMKHLFHFPGNIGETQENNGDFVVSAN